MALIRYRGLGDLPALQDEMNDLFRRFWDTESGASVWSPPVNVSETPNEFIVEVEAPGMDPKDLHVSVTGDQLTIRGQRKHEQESKDKTWHRVERVYGNFSRTFTLPTPVVGDKVAGDYKNGVLRVTLPKADEAKRREVKINVG